MSDNLTAAKLRDGPIARHLNRRISLLVSRAIVRSGVPISPNLMSLISFSTGIVAALLFSFRLPLWGGLLAQLSSILDRLADGGLVIGMTVFAYGDSAALAFLPGDEGLWTVIWGFLALIGAYGISYSSAIARAMGREDYPRAVAGRDSRLFLIMLAGMAAALAPRSMSYFLMMLALSALIELGWRMRLR